MLRALLLCLGLIAVTWLEYEIFPGHTYLEGDTQVYLPMLERMDSPGFLSRDLVATHPDVTDTIYDEFTLFLHEVSHLEFRRALEIQQLSCRAAAILGIFLLAITAGVDDIAAFVLAALLNLGATLIGPDVFLVSREAVPEAFAFGLTLLAAGLFACEKPLLGGLAGGIALVYDPAITTPLWIAVLIGFFSNRSLRRLFRPALTVLLVFVLLLANLAQLQPGVLDRQDFFSRISEPFAALQQYRTPSVWVTLWPAGEVWHYLAILICGLWATARIWPNCNRQMRLLFVALPVMGVISVALSAILLDHLHWSFIPQIQPSRMLLYTVAFASLNCGIAGVWAAKRRRFKESLLWFFITCGLPLNVQLFQFFSRRVPELVIALILSSLLALILTKYQRSYVRVLALSVPLLAIFFMRALPDRAVRGPIDWKPVLELADWAKNNTWGSSMFLFPDAGRDLYPGAFRAASLRALWVDWNSGRLVPYYESFAAEWWQRWQDTMEGGFVPQRLQNMLALPIDYYVLNSNHPLDGIRPVFRNHDFVVYDATDLRRARSPFSYLSPFRPHF